MQETTAKMVQHGDLLDNQSDLGSIRILLVGDPGVGKTSLIHSLVNDEFVPELPDKMATITIPAEVTSEDVPLRITDYSEKQQSYDDLREAIRDSSVICVVYVAGDDDSIKRIATHWLPTIRNSQSLISATSFRPIILVANKIDLVKDDNPLDRVTPIMQEFVEVEAHIEVSASLQKNVVELFSTAQKTVIYPLPPLFDPQLRVLTKKCRNALIDIFQSSDVDGDGLLSDHELNLFQMNCFGIPLQKDSLDDLKSIIRQSIIDGIVNDGITQAGFLFLHTLSLDKGRRDFTWQVLRKFNYDNQLNAKCPEQSTSDIDANFSSKISISSSLGSDTRGDYSDTSYEDETELLTHVHMTWSRDHASIIKAGLGITIATFLSILALRFLAHGGNRSSA